MQNFHCRDRHSQSRGPTTNSEPTHNYTGLAQPPQGTWQELRPHGQMGALQPHASAGFATTQGIVCGSAAVGAAALGIAAIGTAGMGPGLAAIAAGPAVLCGAGVFICGVASLREKIDFDTYSLTMVAGGVALAGLLAGAYAFGSSSALGFSAGIGAGIVLASALIYKIVGK